MKNNRKLSLKLSFKYKKLTQKPFSFIFYKTIMELFFIYKKKQHNNAIVILLPEKSTENGMEIYIKKNKKTFLFDILTRQSD